MGYSYTYVWAAAIGAFEISGTPSIAAGRSSPCQWMEVGESGSWFSTRIRSMSPSRTRISGPGSEPFNSTDGTGCAPSGLVDAAPTARTYCVALGRGTYAVSRGALFAHTARG